MGGGQGAAMLRHAGKRVEGNRELAVGRIEIKHVVGARARHRVDYILGKVAVRIEKCKAATGGEVLQHHVEEERALAGAGLADDVQMAPPVAGTKRNIGARNAAAAEHDGGVRGHRSAPEPVWHL